MATHPSDPWQSAVDHQQLRLVALGVEPGQPRARAIAALADSSVPSRVGDLEALLRDEATPTRLRHLAATLLGRIDRDSAREALSGALDTSDPVLIGRIALSLGRIGDRAAFKAIQKRSSKLVGVASTQARFALRLLAHRFDLDLPDSPDAEVELLPKPGDEGQGIGFGPAHPLEAQIAANALARQPLGIELSERTARQLRCDGSLSLLLLNRAVTQAPLEDTLTSRKQIAAVVARREDTTAVYSVSLIVLTTPDKKGDGAAVSLHQPNGTLVLTGAASAVAKGKGLAFELRSVARRGGVAIHVKGTAVGDRISFATARTGATRRQPGHPTPLEG
jgi:hypothetical protein